MNKIFALLCVGLLGTAAQTPNLTPPQPLVFANNPYCTYVITMPLEYPCELRNQDCMIQCKDEYLYNIRRLKEDNCKQYEKSKEEYYKKVVEIQTKLFDAVSADPTNYTYYKKQHDADLAGINMQYNFNMSIQSLSFDSAVKSMKDSYYSCTRLCCFY